MHATLTELFQETKREEVLNQNSSLYIVCIKKDGKRLNPVDGFGSHLYNSCKESLITYFGYIKEQPQDQFEIWQFPKYTLKTKERLKKILKVLHKQSKRPFLFYKASDNRAAILLNDNSFWASTVLRLDIFTIILRSLSYVEDRNLTAILEEIDNDTYFTHDRALAVERWQGFLDPRYRYSKLAYFLTEFEERENAVNDSEEYIDDGGIISYL